jgi:hypothetical protein
VAAIIRWLVWILAWVGLVWFVPAAFASTPGSVERSAATILGALAAAVAIREGGTLLVCRLAGFEPRAIAVGPVAVIYEGRLPRIAFIVYPGLGSHQLRMTGRDPSLLVAWTRWTTVSGPALNLAAGIGFWIFGGQSLALANLALGIGSLIPIQVGHLQSRGFVAKIVWSDHDRARDNVMSRLFTGLVTRSERPACWPEDVVSQAETVATAWEPEQVWPRRYYHLLYAAMAMIYRALDNADTERLDRLVYRLAASEPQPEHLEFIDTGVLFALCASHLALERHDPARARALLARIPASSPGRWTAAWHRAEASIATAEGNCSAARDALDLAESALPTYSGPVVRTLERERLQQLAASNRMPTIVVEFIPEGDPARDD